MSGDTLSNDPNNLSSESWLQEVGSVVGKEGRNHQIPSGFVPARVFGMCPSSYCSTLGPFQLVLFLGLNVLPVAAGQSQNCILHAVCV